MQIGFKGCYSLKTDRPRNIFRAGQAFESTGNQIKMVQYSKDKERLFVVSAERQPDSEDNFDKYCDAKKIGLYKFA